MEEIEILRGILNSYPYPIVFVVSPPKYNSPIAPNKN